MREFFTGWRRKVGCAIALLAGISSAIWNASYFIVIRTFSLPSGSEFYIAVKDGVIYLDWSPANVTFFPCWAPVLSFSVVSAYLILWPVPKSQNNSN